MVDWKKEIRLSDLVGAKKRDADAEPEREANPEAEATPEKTSIWKKEISFGRKKAAEAPAQSSGQLEAAPTAPVAPEPNVVEAAVRVEPATPIEASAAAVSDPAPPSAEAFENDARVIPVEAPARQDAEPVVLEPEVSEPAASEPPAAPSTPTTELVQEVSLEAREEQSTTVPVSKAEPEFDIEELLALAADLPPPAARPDQALPDSPTPSAAEVEGGTVMPPASVPTAAAEDAAVESPPSAPEPAPPAVIPPPAPPPPADPPPQATAPPQPAEPEVVHPPVPADQLPPVDDQQAKPFYKRDISFGRKQGKGAAPKQPRARRQDAADRKKLSKSIVGLKVGASQIAAARVANNGSAELLQVAREPLEPGVVVAGELRDPAALAEALKAFFAKHKLPKRNVRLGIANNRIGVRAFEIAGVSDPRQLANAIRFRAQEVLPVPIEEAVLDYEVLAERVTEEGETIRRILLVVAYRELVDRYLEACRKAGVNLVGIDLEAFALLRSLHAPRDRDRDGEGDGDAALVAVTIGHERSTFAVSDGRTCEFTRVVDWGGAALNVAIARVLELSPTEAEPIKLELSLLGAEVPAGLTEAQAAGAREAMSRQIQAFARELVSSLQFYQNQPGSLGIGEIAITGGTAHLPGLSQELQRLIGVTVRVGDPLSRVKVGKKLGEPEQVGSLAVAIGLGIED